MTTDYDRTQEDRTHPGAYRAFLIRCWQEAEAGNGCPAWRFTLVQLDDEKTQRGFACLADLVAFLNRTLGLPRMSG